MAHSSTASDLELHGSSLSLTSTTTTAPPTEIRGMSCWSKFVEWHRPPDCTLAVLPIFRFLSVILLFFLSLLDTFVYAYSGSVPFIIRFFLDASYPVYEIATIIYASGAVAFGVWIETYFLIAFGCLNCIVSFHTCDEIVMEVIWCFKVVFLFVATHIAHKNFRRFQQYSDLYKHSAQCMLHQALLFSITILFLAAPGLRMVHEGIMGSCEFKKNKCNMNNMYVPKFKVHDPCEHTYIHYVAGRVELRIIRDFVLLNIASFALCNQGLLNFFGFREPPMRRLWFRVILLIIFLLLSSSILVVNILPFSYYKFKISYDIGECILFLMTIGLMSFNLWIRPLHEPLQTNPRILLH